MKLILKIILPLITLLSNLNRFAADDFTHMLALAKHSSCLITIFWQNDLINQLINI